jgi:hypothetical protein
MKTLLFKTCFISICIVLCSLSSTGQTNATLMNKKITVHSSRIRVDSLLQYFSRQTGVEFSFNSKKISPSKLVSVDKKQQTLSQWLNMLQHSIGVQHKLIGNHIILIDNSNKPAAPKKTISSTPPKINAPKKSTESKQTSSLMPGMVQPAEPMVTRSAEIKKDPALLPADTLLKNESHTAKTIAADIRAENAWIAANDSLSRVKENTVQEIVDHKIQKLKPRKERAPHSPESFSKLDFGPQGIGPSFETRLGNKWMVDLSLGAGGGYAILGNEFKYKLSGLSGPEIYFSINPRYYYNRAKRLAAGKSIARNSGNYWGIRLKYVTDKIAENFVVWDALLFNIHWGMQRPVGKRWVFNSHVGPGFGMVYYLFSKDQLPGLNSLYPSFELKISYLFKKPTEN